MDKKVATGSMKLLLLAWIILWYVPGVHAAPVSPVAKQGVLDLGGWDFEKNGVVKLDGEWEFYWNRLYTPQDFGSKNVTGKLYIQVPGTWNQQAVGPEPLPGKGFATYHVQVKLNHVYD